MGVFDKAKAKAEELVGDAKESFGKATDNEELEDAGKRDQLSGSAKGTVQDAKDKAAGAVHDIKDGMTDRD